MVDVVVVYVVVVVVGGGCYGGVGGGVVVANVVVANVVVGGMVDMVVNEASSGMECPSCNHLHLGSQYFPQRSEGTLH